jgi:hypothetical protein
VVQDDVALPGQIVDALRAALDTWPVAALSLFVEWGSRAGALARLAALAGASWIPVVGPSVPTQALLLPTEVARDAARVPPRRGDRLRA